MKSTPCSLVRGSAPVAVALAAVVALCPSPAGASGVPETLASAATERSAPAWVSASRAVAGGELDLTYFGRGEAVALQGLVHRMRQPPSAEGDLEARAGALQASGCTVSLDPSYIDWEHPRPNATLDDLVTHALGIYRGRVTAAEPGFLFGEPGTLLEVVTERVAKAPSATSTASSFFVFYPQARIELSAGTLCAESGRRAVPQAGDSLLVFAYRQAADAPDVILRPDEEELIFEHGGELSLPRRWGRPATGVALDEVEARVGRLLASRQLQPEVSEEVPR